MKITKTILQPKCQVVEILILSSNVKTSTIVDSGASSTPSRVLSLFSRGRLNSLLFVHGQSLSQEATSNCKRIETLAVFPVNSDIVIVNTHLPPFPLINVVMDLVMIFKVTSNNIERGRGVQKCIKVFLLFSRVRFQLVIQFLRECLNNFAIACRS